LAFRPHTGAAATGRRTAESYRGHAATRTGAATLTAWFKRFEGPIVLDDGRELLTLRDAASYITALPKAESDGPEWQIAMEALVVAAERGGLVTLARIAVMKALGQSPPASELGRKKFRVIG